MFKSIYKFGLSVCLYPINVKTAEPIGPKFFVGHLGTPGKVYWMIEILNIYLHQNSIFIKFFKILKIHEIFCENPRIIFVLFYDVHKENMFTINLEDGPCWWVHIERNCTVSMDNIYLYIYVYKAYKLRP